MFGNMCLSIQFDLCGLSRVCVDRAREARQPARPRPTSGPLELVRVYKTCVCVLLYACFIHSVAFHIEILSWEVQNSYSL